MNEHFEKRIKNIRERLKFNNEERERLSKEITLDALKEKTEEIKTQYNKQYQKSYDNNELNDLKAKLKPKAVDSNMFGSVPTKKEVKWPKAIRNKHQDNRMIK